MINHIVWSDAGIKRFTISTATDKRSKNSAKDTLLAIQFRWTSTIQESILWWQELTKKFLFIPEIWDTWPTLPLMKTGRGALSSGQSLNKSLWQQIQATLLFINCQKSQFSAVIMSCMPEGTILQMLLSKTSPWIKSLESSANNLSKSFLSLRINLLCFKTKDCLFTLPPKRASSTVLTEKSLESSNVMEWKSSTLTSFSPKITKFKFIIYWVNFKENGFSMIRFLTWKRLEAQPKDNIS